jgi:hypothetical protein
LAEVRDLLLDRPGEWSVEVEEMDKRVYLVGGITSDFYVLVTAPWKPRAEEPLTGSQDRRVQ